MSDVNHEEKEIIPLEYPRDARKVVGGPKPARLSTKWPLVLGLFSTGIVGATMALLPIGGSFNSCRGATRSTRLNWQARQQEIDQVVEEQAAKTTEPPR